MWFFWKKFLASSYFPLTVFGLLFLSLTSIFYLEKTWNYYPAFFVAFFALVFTYLAYEFTKEKFRLDLFEKRLEIYEKFLVYCRLCVGINFYSPKLDEDSRYQELQSLDDEFIKKLLPRMKLLFGIEVENAFKQVRDNFVILESIKFSLPQDIDRDFKIGKEKRRSQINLILKDLPNMFQKYIYFGTYKIEEVLP